MQAQEDRRRKSQAERERDQQAVDQSGYRDRGRFLGGFWGFWKHFHSLSLAYFFRNLLRLALCFILLGFWYLILFGPPFLTLLFPL